MGWGVVVLAYRRRLISGRPVIGVENVGSSPTASTTSALRSNSAACQSAIRPRTNMSTEGDEEGYAILDENFGVQVVSPEALRAPPKMDSPEDRMTNAWLAKHANPLKVVKPLSHMIHDPELEAQRDLERAEDALSLAQTMGYANDSHYAAVRDAEYRLERARAALASA